MTPTVSDVKRIAEQSDPVLRNLQITHCYHQLAQAMAERFGHEANWCTFATWASKQAGQTIRKEDLIRALENFQVDEERIRTTEKFVGAMLRFGVRLESEKLVKLMWKAADPEGAFTHSSDAVARGNLKVFKEIGYEFARFNATCLPDTNYNQANITRFMDDLRPGPRPTGRSIYGRPSHVTIGRCSRRRRKHAANCCFWRIYRSVTTNRLACSPRSSKHWKPR